MKHLLNFFFWCIFLATINQNMFFFPFLVVHDHVNKLGESTIKRTKWTIIVVVFVDCIMKVPCKIIFNINIFKFEVTHVIINFKRNHLKKDGWLLWKVNPIVDFWSYNNAFIIEAFLKCELQKCEKEVPNFFLKKKISIQIFKRVVHWNFFNNTNSEFLRSTIVSFKILKIHISLKTPSFLVFFFFKNTWPNMGIVGLSLLLDENLPKCLLDHFW